MSDSLWPHGLYSPWKSPGQNTGVGSCSLLQGIFPTQGLNPGLLYCRGLLYQLSHNTFPLIVHKCCLFSVHPSALVICHLFDNSYSDRWFWHLIAVLIFISLMINDVELLFFLFFFGGGQTFISQFWKLGVQDQGVGRFSVWSGPLSLSTASRFFLCPHLVEEVRELRSPL